MKITNALGLAILAGILVAGVSYMVPRVDKTESEKIAKTSQNQLVQTKTDRTAAHPAAKSNARKTNVKTSSGGANAKVTGPTPGHPIADGDLNWLHIQDASNLKNAEEKMYFVDVFTDWCGWCKVMDKKTFSDPAVQKALNDRFHVVKFNAEQKDPIQFKGQSYDWMAGGRKGVNKLTHTLLGSRLSYPSFVYLDKDLNVVKVTRGYKDVDKFLAELKLITG